MQHCFFLSYARDDLAGETLLDRFFADLCREVGLRVKHLPPSDAVGFMDREMPGGAEWSAHILTALKTSRVLVSLYSPRYFERLYCGKEWEFFHQRSQIYADHAGRAIFIKPIPWVPFDRTPGGEVDKVQIGIPPEFEIIAARGLRYVMRHMRDTAKYRPKYLNFVEHLAVEIASECNESTPQLSSPEVSSLGDVQSAFHGGYVRYVTVAGFPAQLIGVGRKNILPYNGKGGPHWMPFHPGDRTTVRDILTNCVPVDQQNPEVASDQDLVTSLINAGKDGKIVVVVVDSWSTRIDFYKGILKLFDKENLPHCGVVVPWNSSGDDEIKDNSAELRAALETALPKRSKREGTPAYLGSVESITGFQTALQGVISSLKESSINVVSPVPEAGRFAEPEVDFGATNPFPTL